MATKKKRPRKQTRARVSTLAATVMSILGTKPANGRLIWFEPGSAWLTVLTVGELRTLCASVLSQDETRGQK